MPLGNVPKAIQFNVNYTLSVLEVHDHGCWGILGPCHRNVEGSYRIFGVPVAVNSVPNSLPEHFRVHQQQYCQKRNSLNLTTTAEIVNLANGVVNDQRDLLTTYAVDLPTFPIATSKYAPALNITLTKTHFQVEYEVDTKVILKVDLLQNESYGPNQRVCEHYLILRNAQVTFIDDANTWQWLKNSKTEGHSWTNLTKVKLEPMANGATLVRVNHGSLSVIPWQDSFKVPVISPLHNRGPYSPEPNDRIFPTSRHTVAKTLLSIHYNPSPRAPVPLTAQQALEKRRTLQQEKERVETFFNNSERISNHLQLMTNTRTLWQEHLQQRAQLKALPSKTCQNQRDAHRHEDETSKRYLANDICHLFAKRYYHALLYKAELGAGNIYFNQKYVFLMDAHQVIPKLRSTRFSKVAQEALAVYRENLEQSSLPLWTEGISNCTPEEYEAYKQLAIPQSAKQATDAVNPDWTPAERAAYEALTGRTTFQKFAVQEAKDEETWYQGRVLCVSGQIRPPKEVVAVAQIDLPILGKQRYENL